MFINEIGETKMKNVYVVVDPENNGMVMGVFANDSTAEEFSRQHPWIVTKEPVITKKSSATIGKCSCCGVFITNNNFGCERSGNYRKKITAYNPTVRMTKTMLTCDACEKDILTWNS